MSPGISDENRKRLGRINRNFFLHIHANKVHPHSLKTSYTFGLGVILGFLFMVMILTGVVVFPWQLTNLARALLADRHSVEVACTHCGLQRHEADASHCKACGFLIYQEYEG